MIRRIVGFYFSPIGGTAKMIEMLVSRLAGMLDGCSPEEVRCEYHDLLRMTDEEMVLDDETIAVLGVPVYVGKVPIPALKQISRIHPEGAVTVAAVSYGARTFGNALYELNHFAEQQGFKVVGAGAFAVKYGRHRSNENVVDQDAINRFGKAAANKIRRLAGCEIDDLKIRPMPLELSGKLPIHGISRISPRAAAAAQGVLERISFWHRESEWYL